MPNPTDIHDIINRLSELHHARSLSHELELAQYRFALAAASELLERRDEQIERLTTTLFQLMDNINQH